MLALADRVDAPRRRRRTVIAQDRRPTRCRLTVAGRSQPLVDSCRPSSSPTLAARRRPGAGTAPRRRTRAGRRVRAPDAPTLTLPMRSPQRLGVRSTADRCRSTPIRCVALGTDRRRRPVTLDWTPGAAGASRARRDDVATTALTAVLSVALGSSPERHPGRRDAPATTRSPLTVIVLDFPISPDGATADDRGPSRAVLARLAHLLDDGGVCGGRASEPSTPTSPDRRVTLCRPRALADATWAARPRRCRSCEVAGRRRDRRRPRRTPRRCRSSSIDRARRLRGVATADGVHATEVVHSVRAALRLDRTAARACVRSSSAVRSPRSNVDSSAPRPVTRHRSSSTSRRRRDRHDRLGRTASSATAASPLLVPPPLPAEIPLEQLLADNEADAVPIGLADDPVRGRPRRRLVAARAATGRCCSSAHRGPDWTSSIAIADRRHRRAVRRADDLTVHAIDSSNRRLGALQRLPHTRAARQPERLDRAAAIIDARRPRGPAASRSSVAGASDRPDARCCSSATSPNSAGGSATVRTPPTLDRLASRRHRATSA